MSQDYKSIKRPRLGAVAIGRNEGERLQRCLKSLITSCEAVVYVDSGSSDESVSLAESMGVDVVRLDMTSPFTAGRARNAGFEMLCEVRPDIELVQFIDGDCTLEEGWLDVASDYLSHNPEIVIVCGRRKERHPDASIYNRLCDIEWNTPVGDAGACGGDFLIRRTAFMDIGGFDSRLIAGEEPDLCHRLRKEGWRIHRLDHGMTAHDAAIESFLQWARRSRRSGYAYLARAYVNRHDGCRYCWKENLRIAFWSAALPSVIVALGVLVSGWWFLLFLSYPLQFLRLRAKLYDDDRSLSPTTFAFFSLLGNWMEFSGQLQFIFRLVTRSEQAIIEYK